MSSLVSLTQNSMVMARAVALVLLVSALALPQFAWADHAAPDSATLALNPELSAYQRLAHASGQDLAAAANSARWASMGASYSEANEASSARWAALGASYGADDGSAFLAANPELVLFQRFGD